VFRVLGSEFRGLSALRTESYDSKLEVWGFGFRVWGLEGLMGVGLKVELFGV